MIDLSTLLTEVRYPEFNFFSAQRLDPIIFALLRAVGAERLQSAYIAVELVIWFFGVWVFLNSTSCLNPRVLRKNALASGAVVLALVFSLGVDPFFLRAHWFPWLLTAAIILRRKPGVAAALLFSVSSVLWVLSAGSLGVLGAVFSVFGAVLFSLKEGSQERSFWGLVFWIFSLSLLTLAYFFLPVFQMPDYPLGARLTEITPLTLLPPPLLGPFLVPNTVLFAPLQASTVAALIRFGLLTAFAAALLLSARNKRLHFGLWVLLGTCLILGAELAVGFEELQYTPYQTLRRFIPGLALVPFSWALVPFVLVFGLGPLVSKLRLGHGVLLALLLSGVVILEGSGLLTLWRPFENVDHLNRVHPQNHEQFVAESPSAVVVDNFGPWIVDRGAKAKRGAKNLRRLVSGEDFTATVRGAPRSEDVPLAFDGDVHTRWRTAHPQVGGEYLLLEFDRPVKVARVFLYLHESKADFPRGLKVEASMDGEFYKTIFEQPVWLGELRWSRGGYPFFGSQTRVILDFASEEKVRFLRFEQTNRSVHYDWSVSEVLLYRFGDAEKK